MSKNYNLKRRPSAISERWGGHDELVESFAPISSYFLKNYHRIKPHEGADGLNSTQAMLIIQLMDFKWTKEAPFPSIGELANRMGLSARYIRKTLNTLEDLDLLEKRAHRTGGTNKYILEPLFERLSKMYKQDVDETQRKEVEEVEEGVEVLT